MSKRQMSYVIFLIVVFFLPARAQAADEEKLKLYADFLADTDLLTASSDYQPEPEENCWFSLRDVTGDGEEELVVCWNTLSNGYGNTYFYTVEDGEVILIDKLEAGGTVMHPGYSEVSNLPYLYGHVHCGGEQGITLYTLQNGYMEEVISFAEIPWEENQTYFEETSPEGHWSYSINGEEVTYAEYQETFTEYLGETLPYYEDEWTFGWRGYEPIATLENTPENRAEVLGTDGDILRYADEYISFSVPRSKYSQVNQMPGEYGLAYSAECVEPDGGAMRRYVNAAIEKVDLSLLYGVAEQGMSYDGFEELFGTYTDIIEVHCLQKGEIYEFSFRYKYASWTLTNYVRFLGLDPETGLVVRVSYFCASETLDETDYYWSFYQSFRLQTSVDICAQAKGVPVSRTICCSYDLPEEIKNYALRAARIGQAYMDGTLSSDAAIRYLGAIQSNWYESTDYDYYSTIIYDDVQVLIYYIREGQMVHVEITLHNLIVGGELDPAKVSDTSGISQTVWEEPGELPWAPQDPIYYWTDNMQYTYTGSWYDSPNWFTVYMPTSWKRRSVTEQTLEEGIELQLMDATRGISLSIYCGEVSYEPTAEGIYQYVLDNGYQNVRYAVCNGTLYAVQFDSLGIPERQIAFPVGDQVVTLAVYCGNTAIREAFSYDMFSSIIGAGTVFN